MDRLRPSLGMNRESENPFLNKYRISRRLFVLMPSSDH